MSVDSRLTLHPKTVAMTRRVLWLLVQRVGQGICVGPDEPRVSTDLIVQGAGEVYGDVGEVNAGGLCTES